MLYNHCCFAGFVSLALSLFFIAALELVHLSVSLMDYSLVAACLLAGFSALEDKIIDALSLRQEN